MSPQSTRRSWGKLYISIGDRFIFPKKKRERKGGVEGRMREV
jgi:hypothetical protein